MHTENGPKNKIAHSADRVRQGIENRLPMTLNNLIYFLIIVYLITIVSRTIVTNYHSNQSIAAEQKRNDELQDEIRYLGYQINYYQTKSFKEKEAREKLGYKGIGEKMMSVPIDQPEDTVSQGILVPKKIKTPNYRLWWEYFFGQNNG